MPDADRAAPSTPTAPAGAAGSGAADATTAGRADLLAFADEQPANYWRADAHLRRVVAHHAGAEVSQAWEPALDAFGAEAAGPIEALVKAMDRPHHLPTLERWGPYGDRREEVDFHPAYHEAGRRIYGSGVMQVLGEPGSNVRSSALSFLSCLNGEAGHNCPLACTAGAIKAITALGSDALKARWLPRLLSTDYAALAHAAQFLTEVQGGSDVGANAVRAVPDSPPVGADAEDGGGWRIHGEKWFCSNATADLFLMTARVEDAHGKAREGTRGLGLFLVPRRLPSGELNRFHIRRLKEKLGTRAMASGEIDFDGAAAWPVGPVGDGFKGMMTHVITTSRVFNAIGTSAHARRACLVAHGYAHRRRAFGPPIASYPLVQETLSDMRAEAAAMTSGAFHLAAVMDRIELAQASEEEQGFFRVALNLNKLRSAQSAHEVVLKGIELLGGNGAIESFSPLPRLLRDNGVYENWEGTHNVLLVQVLRDAQRMGVHRAYADHLAAMAKGHARLAAAVAEAGRELADTVKAGEAEATLRMRPLGDRLAWLQWACAMHRDGTPPEVVEHFLDRRIGPVAVRDAAYVARIQALSAEPC